MKQLGRIDRLNLGINPSLPNNRCPLWVDGNGILFQEQAVQPEPGQTVLFPKPNGLPVTSMLEARKDTQANTPPYSNAKNVLFFTSYTGGVTPGLHAWEDQATSVVSDLFGPIGSVRDASLNLPAFAPSLVQWGNWVILLYPFITLSAAYRIYKNWPLTASGETGGFAPGELGTVGPYIMVAFKNFLIFMNTTNGSNEVVWSNGETIEPIGEWTPQRNNFAGSLFARDLEGPILAAVPLGDGLAFYGSSTMHMLSFIGAPLVFGERQVQRNIGAVGKQAVANVGGVHYGFGPRGIWRTDGNRVDYIDQPWIHDFVFADLNRDQWSKILVLHNTPEDLVEFHYPTKDSLENNRTVGFHRKTKLWTIKNFARTAGSPADNFQRPVYGDAEGNVFMQEISVVGRGSVGAPLTLAPTWTAPGFYGEMGYGTGGYGGHGGDG